MPVLGICRGLQVLNVVRGGTLIQHLPDLVGDAHKPVPGSFGPRHPVTLAPGTALSSALGVEPCVTTHHHQAAERLGRDVEAIGWSQDGVVEAIALRDVNWAYGVQWHPEAGPDQALFDAFVAAARMDLTTPY